MNRLDRPLGSLRLSQTEPPRLLVVIDTEEEFDWSAPLRREATNVTAMRHIHRGQAVFDEFGLTPCYVADYPVVSQVECVQPLREIFDSGRCVIGAHLHPWVTPPHDEEVSRHLSFPGNLPGDLEARKIEQLNSTIGEVFGEAATVYKAGRYGIGPETGETLERLGFEVDLSPLPAFDFRLEGGPDFRGFPVDPYPFGSSRRLLCIPGTAAFLGSPWLFENSRGGLLERLRIPGILSRLRLADRLHLSPEGYSVAEQVRLTRALIGRGTRVFTLSFHSPSLAPGHTPYVHSDADLERFLGSIRSYCEFFFGDLGGLPATPLEIRQLLLDEASAAA